MTKYYKFGDNLFMIVNRSLMMYSYNIWDWCKIPNQKMNISNALEVDRKEIFDFIKSKRDEYEWSNIK